MKRSSRRTITYNFDEKLTLSDLRELVEETKDIDPESTINFIHGGQRDPVMQIIITEQED